MKKSANTRETFKQYLVRMAVVTNKSTYAMDARNILNCFVHTGIKKMRTEKVSAALIDVPEITHSAWRDAGSYMAVDPCLPSAGWEGFGNGCHKKATHYGI